MQLKRIAISTLLGLVISTQCALAQGRLPEEFQGWFVPAPQTCAAAVVIEVSASEIRTAAGVQQVTLLKQPGRFPRWLRLGLETVGGAGTEEVVIELAQNGMDLRVFYGDGTWLTWRRCL